MYYGENSINVLKSLKETKKRLLAEKRRLQKSNQKLQKDYFELLRLNGN
jgi:hypothetical protein